MKRLNVISYPDPRLKMESVEVESIDVDFIKDLEYTMYCEDGVGIAAIQVGVPQKIFLIDGRLVGQEDCLVFVNPVMSEVSAETRMVSEGCLSFPGRTIRTKRKAWVEVTALDINGQQFVLRGEGLLAQAMEHEYEHLIGVTLEDKVPKRM